MMKKIILLITTIILLFSISYASENKWQILRVLLYLKK